MGLMRTLAANGTRSHNGLIPKSSPNASQTPKIVCARSGTAVISGTLWSLVARACIVSKLRWQGRCNYLAGTVPIRLIQRIQPDSVCGVTGVGVRHHIRAPRVG